MLKRMIVGRLIGWLFLLAGLAVLASDMMHAAASQAWNPVGLGQLWQRIAPSTLSSAQAATDRYMGVYAWQIIEALLTVWAFAALVAIGLGLLIAFHRRRDVIQ